MDDPTEFERLRAQREVTRKRYPVLFERVSEIMYRHDPMGISMGENRDEYDAEAGTIIPRLRLAHDAADVATIVRQEMEFWFGAAMAEPEEGFGALAHEVWEVWLEAGDGL